MTNSLPSTPKKPNLILRAVIALGVIALILLVWRFTTSTPARPQSSGVWGNTGNNESPFRTVTFTGDGDGASSNEERMGGDYDVTWTTNDCYYSFTLKGAGREDVGSSSDTLSGSNTVYDIEEGRYHLDVITGPSGSCAWSVRFVPR